MPAQVATASVQARRRAHMRAACRTATNYPSSRAQAKLATSVLTVSPAAAPRAACISPPSRLLQSLFPHYHLLHRRRLPTTAAKAATFSRHPPARQPPSALASSSKSSLRGQSEPCPSVPGQSLSHEAGPLPRPRPRRPCARLPQCASARIL